jgi:uncharacterized membrane protein
MSDYGNENPSGSFRDKGNNKKAVAGFVCSLVGLVCCTIGIPNIVGLVLSIVGLNEINKDKFQEGKGLAIAGIVLGALGILAFVIGVIFLILNWDTISKGYRDGFNSVYN